VYGIFFTTWQLGLTFGAGIAWTERLQSLGAGWGDYLVSDATKAVPDNLLFLTLMSALFWFISVHSGYTLTRYANPWVLAIPSGLAIVLIHTYDPVSRRIWYLIIYLFLTLLLVARMFYINQRRRWEQTAHTCLVSWNRSHPFRPDRLSGPGGTLLVYACLARALPAAKNSWDRVVTPRWNDVRNVFENAFASLRTTMGMTGEFYGPIYPWTRQRPERYGHLHRSNTLQPTRRRALLLARPHL